jgi:hypothetical protein
MSNNISITVDAEFIKLARSLRDAQKEAKFSQRFQRRAQSLESMFDTKLALLEKQVAQVEQAKSAAQPADRLL